MVVGSPKTKSKTIALQKDPAESPGVFLMALAFVTLSVVFAVLAYANY
jgi:hypothetical protein